MKNFCLLIILLLASCTNSNNELYLLVGTYTSNTSKGIYVYKFDDVTANAVYVSEAEVSNPSFLALSEDNEHLYCVSEGEQKEAVLNSFSFNKGILTFINSKPTFGDAPCHVSVNENFAVTSNYSGGNISVFPLEDTGSLAFPTQIIGFDDGGPQSHLHCTAFSPDGRQLFATDLGKNKVYKFKVSENSIAFGEPGYYNVEEGSGPRHITFHPNGRHAYLINELSGMVTVFDYDNRDLKTVQYIASDQTTGEGTKGSADIHVSPDGKFVYSSNRITDNGIAIFNVNKNNGKLTRVGHQSTGLHPRNFIISPSGNHLLVACKDSNVITVYQRDINTGMLKDIGKPIELDSPVCLKFAYK